MQLLWQLLLLEMEQVGAKTGTRGAGTFLLQVLFLLPERKEDI